MLKNEARKIFREKRDALSSAERKKLNDLLLIQFQKVDLPFLHTILSYLPIEENKEPDTDLITGFLEFRNPALNLAYPKINAETRTIQAMLTNADTAFQKGIYNVPEPISDHFILPEAFDLVLVPLLICDSKGFRVGYGKGFYDRYLPHCRSDCIKAGFLYFEPVDEITDTDEFDVPLDLCITPYNIYVF
jgi:5-formyltetrahydrofolate cyclo-ligase